MQYIITKDQRDNFLQIMRSNMQDPDAYDAIAEIESLPVLEGAPVARFETDIAAQAIADFNVMKSENEALRKDATS